MNASKEEYLSAVLDDAADRVERDSILSTLREDAELGNTLSRYALIGEVMRSRTKPIVAKTDFLAGIHAGLDDEPVYDEKVIDLASRAPKRDTQNPTALAPRQRNQAKKTTSIKYGLATAAAVVAVVGATMLLNQPPKQAEVVASAPIQPAALVQLAQAKPIRSANQLDPQSRDVLRQYVAQHVKYASTTAIVPSVRAVSYSNDY
ncbi:sigma-E factor negative regulatory protein [uncultured Thiothrix sp.]|uniref:sigma-E factor negative regulatory protein n=1 Tax=uncultured Thiothrix sp. TaxID=223185 RepID=UPI00261C268C|nr:sigma-E factor negative regulatory protein [uncultured Thiothrix sp.]